MGRFRKLRNELERAVNRDDNYKKVTNPTANKHLHTGTVCRRKILSVNPTRRQTINGKIINEFKLNICKLLYLYFIFIILARHVRKKWSPRGRIRIILQSL